MASEKMTQEEIPKFAILLAAYNGEKYIEEQIESIITQKNVDCTIFISIDHATDNTEEICKEIANENKKVKILKKSENRFGSAGKNFYHLFREVDFDSFDYVALSDQDDIWKKEKLIRAHQTISNEKSLGYSSDVECFWESGRRNIIIKKSYSQKCFDHYFEPAGPGCTYVLKTALAKSLKEYISENNNLPFHHDWFIYAFSRDRNFKWVIDNQANILYRQHNSNQVGANRGLKQYIKRLKKLKDKSYKNEVLEILGSLKNEKIEYNKIRRSIIKNPFNYRRNNKEAIFLFFFCLLGWI